MNTVTLPASKFARYLAAFTSLSMLVIALQVSWTAQSLFHFLVLAIAVPWLATVYAFYAYSLTRPRTFCISDGEFQVTMGKHFRRTIPLNDIERVTHSFDRLQLMVNGRRREFDAQDPAQILNLFRHTGEFKEEFGVLVRR